MKNTIFILILVVSLATTMAVKADLPVIDPSILIQSIAEVQLTIQQVEQITTEVKRLGDPASFLPAGASEVIQSLSQTGVGKTWNQLRNLADGEAAMLYDGDGLYHAVGQAITTSDGSQVPRSAEDYKKFDAIAQATSTLEAVMKNTEVRRQQVLDQIKSTTGQLRTAQTVSETQKLLGVLSAQAAELGAIDRERQGALNRVEAQKVENETDAAKQAQAHQEESIVDFQAAQQKLGQFLIPNTSSVQIPDPRASQP